METSPAPLLSLGKYQLVRHLATGGMAEVLLARVQGIEGFERHVVIKKIRDDRARDPMFVQMFLDEARLAASLHHSNIVHVHDIGHENGEYFFTMEYVHGEDLRRVLAHLAERDRLMPLQHCVTIALATAAALHHAHEHRGPDRSFAGIVHRDVSPANIVVAYDGNVKVVDFGIAKLARRSDETGLMKGKVAYMSPEQCLGQDVDRRSDVFCLGIVLYELVTVRRLFKGADDFATRRSITHGVIPPPSGIRPELPLELEAIILKALARRPEDRYQTADELRAALERFAADARMQTSTTALADFMRAELGQRDVPWMIAEDDPEMSIDFDGSGEGIVEAPRATSEGEARAARAKSLSMSDAMTTPGAVAPKRRGHAATTLVPHSRRARRRRTAVALGGAVGVLAAGLLTVMALASGGSAPAGAAGSLVAPAAAAPAPAAAAVPGLAAPPAPITPPNLMPSIVAAPGRGPAADRIADKAADKTVEKKPRATKRSSRKPSKKGVWDPKALLPPK